MTKLCDDIFATFQDRAFGVDNARADDALLVDTYAPNLSVLWPARVVHPSPVARQQENCKRKDPTKMVLEKVVSLQRYTTSMIAVFVQVYWIINLCRRSIASY